MPKIKVNDISLYYEIYGKGQPIVFISGFAADHLAYQNVIEKFAKQYQVILFDNRGIGQSDAPDFPYTIAMFADDVIGLCDALNIKKAHFVGNSMGGMILQDLAYRYPHYVRSVVMENTAMQTGVGFSLNRQGVYALMLTGASRRALTQLTLGWIFSENFLQQKNVVEILIELNLQNPYPITAVGYKNQMHALAHFDSRVWAHKINVPCLITGGDKDIIFAAAKVRELASLIPNSLYHCFDNVAHIPHIEVPEQFCELVLGFMGLHS